MAETDWTFLNDGLDAATVDRGVTNGIARPPGGGNFVYGFNSLSTAQGTSAPPSGNGGTTAVRV